MLEKGLKTLAEEQDVFDVITDAMVAQCETVDELITTLEENAVINAKDISYANIVTVATECFNDYWAEYNV
jgi:hypothetical protein